jgi:hypothetical protein
MAEMNLDDWPGWPGRNRSRGGCCDDAPFLSRPPCVPPDWKIHVRRALEARELGRRLRESHPVADTCTSHPIILVRQDSNPAYVVTVAWQEG